VPAVQSGGGASGGRGRGRRVSTSLSEINVVPLVDVMLVLLIIFMVTSPMIQRGVDVKLPVARRANVIEGERVFVTIPATFKNDGMVYVGSDRVRAEVLEARVRQKMQGASDKRVYLRGDSSVQLSELMSIFSRLRDAGVEDIGIVAKDPGDL
jgi:biopolymer transport protein TolR